MDWILPALFGFALGLAGSLISIRLERNWQKKDESAYNKKVIESLIVEIEEGIGRAKYMADLLDDGNISPSRIYIALWQSTGRRLAETLADMEALALLHRIYYRFDLINFNCESTRPESGAAFAKQYFDELCENLSKLKVLVKKM